VPAYLARLWIETKDAFLDTLFFQVFLALLLVSVSLFIVGRRASQFAAPPRSFLYFVALPGTYVLTHFILFPAMWSRVFAAFFMLPVIYIFEQRRLTAHFLEALRRRSA
jgi:hypothetical protein